VAQAALDEHFCLCRHFLCIADKADMERFETLCIAGHESISRGLSCVVEDTVSHRDVSNRLVAQLHLRGVLRDTMVVLIVAE
jgi:hypothetical protein